MSVILRYHGRAWAEFEVVSDSSGRAVSLRMRRNDHVSSLIDFTVVNDALVYSTATNVPMLGGTRSEGKEESEFAKTSHTRMDK